MLCLIVLEVSDQQCKVLQKLHCAWFLNVCCEEECLVSDLNNIKSLPMS